MTTISWVNNLVKDIIQKSLDELVVMFYDREGFLRLFWCKCCWYVIAGNDPRGNVLII